MVEFVIFINFIMRCNYINNIFIIICMIYLNIVICKNFIQLLIISKYKYVPIKSYHLTNITNIY
jgi:hypothetical protein